MSFGLNEHRSPHNVGFGYALNGTAAVALLMMNFSRSGRTVDESRAWLKRIIITWAVLNGLGFIMSYVTPFFSGGQWTAP